MTVGNGKKKSFKFLLGLSNKKKSVKLGLLTYFLTTLISFTSVTWYAGARHCPERKCVVYCAICIAGTWGYGQAGVFAFLLQAGLSAGAVPVCCTFNLG